MSKRAEKLAYMVSQAAISKAEIGANAAPSPRATQKRWPMAFSILGAVAVSVAMWIAIGWLVIAFLGLLN